MSHQQHSQKTQEDNEIDLMEFWHAIWASKFIIIIITAIFTISSIFYAKSLPNIYKASILLSSASTDSSSSGVSGLASQFGGIASLAGINLSSGNDKTTLAIEIIKSRSFIENFIKKYKLTVPLMAVERFDLKTNTFFYKEDTYDISTKKWIRDVSFPKTPKPSTWEVYKEFQKSFQIFQDTESRMITATIEYYAPEQAKQWLILLIKEINHFIKIQDEKETKEAINYLTAKLNETNITNMQTVFYQLIEEQSKNMMLTQIKDEYVFKTIDPAQVPEVKSGPERSLIVIIGTLLGGILSVIFVLIRYFIIRGKAS